MEAGKQKPIHVVFFDLGNTLIYSQGHTRARLRQAAGRMATRLRGMGCDIQKSELTNLLLTTITDYHKRRDSDLFEITTEKLLIDALLETKSCNVAQEQVAAGLESYYGFTQSLWVPEEDVLETFSALEQAGLRLGLISNAGYAWDVHCLIDKCKIRHFLSQITISAEVGVRKPHPDIFNQALRAFKCKPQNALMVGDNLIADILGADKLGMHTAWLSRRADPQQVKSAGKWIVPQFEIQSLLELPALIAAHNRDAE